MGVQTFGQMVRIARVAREWNQAQLAKRVDAACDAQQVSKWERDQNRPGDVRTARLVKILELDQAAAWTARAVPPATAKAARLGPPADADGLLTLAPSDQPPDQGEQQQSGNDGGQPGPAGRKPRSVDRRRSA